MAARNSSTQGKGSGPDRETRFCPRGLTSPDPVQVSSPGRRLSVKWQARRLLEVERASAVLVLELA